MSKVYSIVIKMRSDCSIYEKKMNKSICSNVCVCELQSVSFNEKENNVTITGTFDPYKIMTKVYRKVGNSIHDYEIKEIVKEETAPSKKNGQGEKNIKKKVTFILPPEGKKNATKPLSDTKASHPAADPPLLNPEKKSAKPKPMMESSVVVSKPVAMACSGWVIGDSVGWCPSGCCYRAPDHGIHEQKPSTYAGYGAQNMHYVQNCDFFSEEDSVCKQM